MRRVNYRKTLSRAKLRVELRAKRVAHKKQGKQGVHFLHIGKTGGSAVRYAIKRCPVASSDYVIFLHGHDVTLRDVPKGDSIVFFLRDPISKFVSGFLSRQRQGRPKYFHPWSPMEEMAFSHFSTPNQLATALSSSDVEEQERSQMAMRNIGHIRSSYWDWFGSEEYFRSRFPDVFFIGFQERLAEDFEVLKSKLGLPDNAQLPNDDVQAHRNPANLDWSLEDKAIENLKNWYIDEFEFINLCKGIILEHQALGSLN